MPNDDILFKRLPRDLDIGQMMSNKQSYETARAERAANAQEASKAPKPVSPKTLRVRAAAKTLAGQKLAQRVPAGAPPREEYNDGTTSLPVTEIDFYDRNPRVSKNPKYDEIKASIKERGGLEGALSVVQRPNAPRYMLYMGGNTRLQILKELWEETRDERFRMVRVAIEKWRGEANVLTAHLIENEARADTKFYEKALGIAMLREELQKERGCYVSLRDLETETQRLGMPGNHATLAEYAFASEHLAPIGSWLTREVSTTLRIEHTALQRLATIANLEAGRFESAMADVYRNAAELNPPEAAQGTVAAPVISLAQRGEVIVRRMRNALAELLELSPTGVDPLAAAVARKADDDEIRGLLEQARTQPASGQGVAEARPAAPVRSTRRSGAAGAKYAGVKDGAVARQRMAGAVEPGDANEQQAPPPDASAESTESRPVASAPRTGEAGAAAEAADADDEDAAKARWYDTLRAFCARHDLADLLRIVDFEVETPAGFWMEFPERPLDDRASAEAGRSMPALVCAYNYLASLSGQFHEATVEQLPADSRWVAQYRREVFDDGGFDNQLMQHASTLADTQSKMFGLADGWLAWLLSDRETWASLDRLARAWQDLREAQGAGRER